MLNSDRDDAFCSLPTDLAAAHVMILAQREMLAEARSEAKVWALEIERLKLMLAKMRREKFGQSSERGKQLIEGIEIDVSTLAGWVGGCVATLDPILEAIRRHLAADRLHVDNTTVPVLGKFVNAGVKPGHWGGAKPGVWGRRRARMCRVRPGGDPNSHGLSSRAPAEEAVAETEAR
jgi:hypothetical protein